MKYEKLNEKRIVEKWLAECTSYDSIVLNAGSGGTEYNAVGRMIHTEKIDLPESSVDCVVCVGSVLNYADAQRSLSEFSRILKPGGFLILEFERSNSAEFLLSAQYGKYIFPKEYVYNSQSHLLWMYSEKHVRQMLNYYGFCIRKCRRIHSLSSLLYRFGLSEEAAAPYSKLDPLLQALSYPLAHNTLLFCTKQILSK